MCGLQKNTQQGGRQHHESRTNQLIQYIMPDRNKRAEHHHNGRLPTISGTAHKQIHRDKQTRGDERRIGINTTYCPRYYIIFGTNILHNIRKELILHGKSSSND